MGFQHFLWNESIDSKRQLGGWQGNVVLRCLKCVQSTKGLPGIHHTAGKIKFKPGLRLNVPTECTLSLNIELRPIKTQDPPPFGLIGFNPILRLNVHSVGTLSLNQVFIKCFPAVSALSLVSPFSCGVMRQALRVWCQNHTWVEHNFQVWSLVPMNGA